jgi:hypothetical protein
MVFWNSYWYLTHVLYVFSVSFSEGKGLNHEDERSYTGSIRENDNGDGLLVEGDVFVGSDLGSDARPEPVAVFTLKVRTTKKENQGDNDLFSELGAFE